MDADSVASVATRCANAYPAANPTRIPITTEKVAMGQMRNLGGCWWSSEKIESCASPNVGVDLKAGSESCLGVVAVSDAKPIRESDESDCCALIVERPRISLLYTHGTKLSNQVPRLRGTRAITSS